MKCERCLKPAEKTYDVTKQSGSTVTRLLCEPCRAITAAVYKVRVSRAQPAPAAVAEPESESETPAPAEEAADEQPTEEGDTES